MTDSQWPRYEVFKQDRPEQPFRNVGSVHAPDAEVALLNARDVFARRPSCHSLWVVPAQAIVTETGTPDSVAEQSVATSGSAETYAVFAKQSDRQSMTYVDYVGDIEANSPNDALAQAGEAFPDITATVWWACAAAAITRSEPEDTADLLAPAQTKLFRMPNQYRTVFTMQKIKRGEEGKG